MNMWLDGEFLVVRFCGGMLDCVMTKLYMHTVKLYAAAATTLSHSFVHQSWICNGR